MITTSDVQRLIQHPAGTKVLSLYLDMSVTSDNKRTHNVFLNKERARFASLDSDRANHHREPLGELLARVERWINDEFDASNRGVAIFGAIGGDWFEAFQFRTPVKNRLEVLDQPVIGPLTEVVHSHPQTGVIVVDREHLRLLALHMGTVTEDYSLAPDAIDTPHDVQAGGHAHKDYQKRKAEESRQFFREFVEEIGRFEARVRPDNWVLLGTTENVQHFRDLLPKSVTDRLAHVGSSPEPASGQEIARLVHPALEAHAEQREAEALNVVQDRVRQSHFASSGMHETLVQLQEGKVERLVVARDLEKDGVQCTQCGFYLVRRDGACPYCGGSLRDGVDLVESMIRMAATQAVSVDFVPADRMQDLKGVAALLKF
ncbi:MAG TPA: VLRF1 family aeRF1-type release factor [Longimicrobiales bacterium]|nr:VLRF1 family aeRF1-type release factor [Longimicrobiales bacterium]